MRACDICQRPDTPVNKLNLDRVAMTFSVAGKIVDTVAVEECCQRCRDAIQAEVQNPKELASAKLTRQRYADALWKNG